MWINLSWWIWDSFIHDYNIDFKLGQTCKCKSHGTESYQSVDYGIAPYYYDENGNINSQYDYNDTGNDLLLCRVTKKYLCQTGTAGDHHCQMIRAMNWYNSKWSEILKTLQIWRLQTRIISNRMTLYFYWIMKTSMKVIWLIQDGFHVFKVINISVPSSTLMVVKVFT